MPERNASPHKRLRTTPATLLSVSNDGQIWLDGLAIGLVFPWLQEWLQADRPNPESTLVGEFYHVPKVDGPS